MSKYYIVGLRGNMARRYRACLEYLGHKVVGHDDGETFKKRDISTASGIIICSPTTFHMKHVQAATRYDLPILCEKPFTRKLADISDFESTHGVHVGLVQMVNQYAFLDQSKLNGVSSYDYFKSGGDGLLWDCINLIGLARGVVRLADRSPIWRCQLNGQTLKIADMDLAYISMLSEWTRNPVGNWDYIRRSHERVNEWQRYLSESKHVRAVSDYLESPWS